MINDLIALGLTDGEARVFVSLIRMGQSTAGKIVKESRVSYSKVYEVLDRLMAKGLVSYSMKGQIRHFVAVEPYRLKDYVDRKQAELEAQKEAVGRLTGKLAKISHTSGFSNAEIFVGLKGLKTAYESLFEGAEKGEVLRYFYPFSSHHEASATFFSKLNIVHREKKIEERGLAPAEFKGSGDYRRVAKDAKWRFVGFPLPGTMDIFRGKVLVVSWEDETAILIQSFEIANHFCRYFDSVWEMAGK